VSLGGRAPSGVQGQPLDGGQRGEAPEAEMGFPKGVANIFPPWQYFANWCRIIMDVFC